jgi:hypothetical protein
MGGRGGGGDVKGKEDFVEQNRNLGRERGEGRERMKWRREGGGGRRHRGLDHDASTLTISSHTSGPRISAPKMPPFLRRKNRWTPLLPRPPFHAAPADH